MLDWLRVRNLAILREVSLEFGGGLNVLTGETGVGKSVLLESFALALGGRARSGLIGAAADRAVVEAGFSAADFSPAEEAALGAALSAAGADGEGGGGGEVVVRREIRQSAAGSVVNRITINGAAAPVAGLRSVGRRLAEVYSQGEHLALLRPGAARETVDEVGGHAALRGGTAAAYRALVEAERRFARLDERLRRAEEERGEMERAVSEIGEADPRPGEREELGRERRLLGDADRLIARLDEAWDALYGSERSAGVLLGVARRALDAAAEMDPVTESLLQDRPDLVAETEDLASSVRERREAVEAGPERLAEIEERLALLRRLERRYGAPADELAELARRHAAALGELTGEEDARRRAESETRERRSAYLDAARRLTDARKAAAAVLGRAVEEELAGLGIPRARLLVAVEAAGPDFADGEGEGGGDGEARPADSAGRGAFAEHGLDRVEFRFSANPESPPAPVSEVASGGEASRFFLALKAAGAGKGGGRTLVFDEADSGTSGRIADAVGRRLVRLAAGRQVLSVTHLPQVAALGRSHQVVEKLESGRMVRVRSVSGADRTEEIARMLAGPEVTDSARRHAEQLLAGVRDTAAVGAVG